MKNKKKSSIESCGLITIWICVTLFAFNETAAAKADKTEIETLNEITVTAQKTEENLQDIPISMTVFSDIDLEDREIEQLNDLAYYVPNFYLLNLSDVGSYTPSMRGLMSLSESFSSTVGLYVDGIPTTNNIGFNTILTNIERVEVLRGPQGALYGKNTEAGVINVITQKPGNQKSGRISISHGEGHKKDITLVFNSPLVKDKLFVGIAGRFYQKEGFLKNTLTRKYDDDRENYFGKVNFRFTPSEKLEISLISSLYQSDNGAFSLNSKTAKNLREYQTDLDGFMRFSDLSHALKINYAFSGFDLESVTAYRKSTDKRWLDYDFTPAKIYHLRMKMPHETVSEELKLNGAVRDLKWLVGLFASHYRKSGGYHTESVNPKFAGQFDTNMEENSFGIFAHLNYTVTDNLKLIGGIRYNKDTRELEDFSYNYHGKESFSTILPKFAIEYQLTEASSVYATIAKGYKSGGFFILAPKGYSKEYDSETLWNYELGIKNNLLGGRLTANANAYYMDISDMQVVSAISEYFGYMSNAASATSKGLELDINYHVNKHLTVFGTLGLNKTTFNKFQDFKGRYDGNDNPFAPKYNYSIGAKFRGFGGFYASGDITGYGKMYLDNTNTIEHKAYNLINAKIGYEWSALDLYLYADNLFDQRYDLIGYFGQNAILSPPREIGAKLTWRF